MSSERLSLPIRAARAPRDPRPGPRRSGRGPRRRGADRDRRPRPRADGGGRADRDAAVRAQHRARARACRPANRRGVAADRRRVRARRLRRRATFRSRRAEARNRRCVGFAIGSPVLASPVPHPPPSLRGVRIAEAAYRDRPVGILDQRARPARRRGARVPGDRILAARRRRRRSVAWAAGDSCSRGRPGRRSDGFSGSSGRSPPRATSWPAGSAPSATRRCRFVGRR